MGRGLTSHRHPQAKSHRCPLGCPIPDWSWRPDAPCPASGPTCRVLSPGHQLLLPHRGGEPLPLAWEGNCTLSSRLVPGLAALGKTEVRVLMASVWGVPPRGPSLRCPHWEFISNPRDPRAGAPCPADSPALHSAKRTVCYDIPHPWWERAASRRAAVWPQEGSALTNPLLQRTVSWAFFTLVQLRPFLRNPFHGPSCGRQPLLAPPPARPPPRRVLRQPPWSAAISPATSVPPAPSSLSSAGGPAGRSGPLSWAHSRTSVASGLAPIVRRLTRHVSWDLSLCGLFSPLENLGRALAELQGNVFLKDLKLLNVKQNQAPGPRKLCQPGGWEDVCSRGLGGSVVPLRPRSCAQPSTEADRGPDSTDADGGPVREEADGGPARGGGRQLSPSTGCAPGRA
uniref:Uncharacterized protein n=1 Tax=Rangifer tarandus platyrhynchus TaxID=3082113 RepID=A0ACB0E5Q0_RANTA|nr:unnamed protein product [Rangifer tarandus platyrhynchus]